MTYGVFLEYLGTWLARFAEGRRQKKATHRVRAREKETERVRERDKRRA